MPASPLKVVEEVLKRESTVDRIQTKLVPYLMDMLYYGEFQIFEQVSSDAFADHLSLVGVKGKVTGKPPLWLVCTVSTGKLPVPGTWSHTGGDPLAPTVEPEHGLLTALGANSGKVDVILKLLAASRFRSETLNRPIFVVAMMGDEGRNTGIGSFLELAETEGGIALMSAPTNLIPCQSHPGCLAIRMEISRRPRHRRMPPRSGFYELTIEGVTGHPQASRETSDALTRGLELVSKLREADDIRVLFFDAGEQPNRVAGQCRIIVGTSTGALPPLGPGVEVQEIADGTPIPLPVDTMFDGWLQAHEVGVAAIRDKLAGTAGASDYTPRVWTHLGELTTEQDSVVGTIFMWRGPEVDTPTIVESLAAAAQSALIGTEELSIAIDVIQDRLPLASKVSPELEKVVAEAMEDAGLLPVFGSSLVTTDGGDLSKAGLDVLAFGPGTGPDGLYCDNESVPVANIEAAFKFYESFISRLCLD